MTTELEPRDSKNSEPGIRRKSDKPMLPKTAMIAEVVKQSVTMAAKVAGSALIVLTEVALVVGVGAYVGSYISNSTIAGDCKKVNLAKVGDVYIKCTIVELPKDPIDHPPR